MKIVKLDANVFPVQKIGEWPESYADLENERYWGTFLSWLQKYSKEQIKKHGDPVGKNTLYCWIEKKVKNVYPIDESTLMPWAFNRNNFWFVPTPTLGKIVGFIVSKKDIVDF